MNYICLKTALFNKYKYESDVENIKTNILTLSKFISLVLSVHIAIIWYSFRTVGTALNEFKCKNKNL